MRIVSIPVSTFSKKIILHENGYQEPISYDRSNEQLFIYLSCLQGKSRKSSDALGVLTDQLDFVCHDHLAKQITQNVIGAGWILNRMYRQKLNEYIAAQAEIGMGMTAAMRHFLDVYAIELDVAGLFLPLSP